MGDPLPMDQYKGKVILIVNTATKCGLTPQLSELESLHLKYKNNGLHILGFPCNQFAWQEPLSNENMEDVCFNTHRVTFQLTAKIHVNGPRTHPIFKFLKKEKKGFLMGRIGWNFTKFLIDQKGNVIQRYAPNIKPTSIEKDIISLLI